MLETIAVIVVLILCTLGAVELCRALSFRFLLPARCKDFLVLVPVRGHDDTMEIELRCAVSRVKWFRGQAQVICLDCGMDEETKMLCAASCEQLGGVMLMTPEELCLLCGEELQSANNWGIIDGKNEP